MKRLWIERLEVEGMGCLGRVDVPLTPLHAFIGPNDAGKSTLLLAVAVAMSHLPGQKSPASVGKWLEVSRNQAISLTLHLSGGYALEIVRRPGQTSIRARSPESGDGGSIETLRNADASHPLFPIKESMGGGARMVRWDADKLREPSTLIPAGHTASFADDRGTGLPGVFDVIFNREDDPREEIQQRVRTLFPAVRAIRLKNVSQSEKALEVVLVTGEVVPTETLSEGLLYYLAFLALEYLEPVSVLLVEEPENGLHPARIADVVRTLRKISERCQVLLATHSPLVINELQPEEVTVVTRDPHRGTITTPLKDTANLEERSRVYALGELWLSYASGEDEAPLLKGVSKP